MNLIQFLEKNSNTRKIFGRREIKIIEKQVHGIALTQSEKNRLSRDIRKKFEFIKEVSHFKEEFKLKQASEVKKLVEIAKKEILNHPLKKKIKKIMLFGSSVKKNITIRSDIDITVIFSKVTKKEAFDFRKNILGKLPDKVDIQVFNFLPDKIKKSILKTNKVLYRNE